MKCGFILGLLQIGFWFGSYGQSQDAKPIALLANEHTKTTIFFPSAIARTIDAAANFNFEYLEDDHTIGLLNAKSGSTSNLTVITDDGFIYSFSLRYSEKIETFNFILATDMAVGRITNKKSRPIIYENTESKVDFPTETTTKDNIVYTKSIRIKSESSYSDSETVAPIVNGYSPSQASSREESDESYQENFGDLPSSSGESDLYDVDREEYYRIFCENNYLQKTIFMRTFRQNKRVVLKLNNILTDKNEIYFVLQVENNSRKEYLVNGLSFFQKTGVGQLQKIMEPLYVFNLQDKIDPLSINEVVFVFKRFTISNKEKVFVVLDELNNNRMVMLPLTNKQINASTN